MNKVISIYLKFALVIDFFITMILGLIILRNEVAISSSFIQIPSEIAVNNMSSTLISISATLIGFLLTIITVVVTFKKGYDTSSKEIENKEVDYTKPPEISVFDKKISKEEQFYGSEIYKGVVQIFTVASFELALIVFFLLIFQLHVIKLSLYDSTCLMALSLFIISFAVFRSLLIFYLYLKVHLPSSSDK